MLIPGNTYRFSLNRRVVTTPSGWRRVFPDAARRAEFVSLQNSSGNLTPTGRSAIATVAAGINGLRISYGYNTRDVNGNIPDWFVSDYQARSEFSRLQALRHQSAWLFGLVPTIGTNDVNGTPTPVDSEAGLVLPQLRIGEAVLEEGYYESVAVAQDPATFEPTYQEILLYVYFQRRDNGAWFSIPDTWIGSSDMVPGNEYPPRPLYFLVDSGFDKRNNAGPGALRTGHLDLVGVQGQGGLDDQKLDAVTAISSAGDLSAGPIGFVDEARTDVSGYAPGEVLYDFIVRAPGLVDYTDLDGNWLVEEEEGGRITATYMRLVSLATDGPDNGGLRVILRRGR